ncbi:MAG: CRISPR-associated endonuclease Cas1 [Cyanobacteriota bacterium]
MLAQPKLDWQLFLSADNFWQAWLKVRRNRGCAGVDGETVEAFEQDAVLSLILAEGLNPYLGNLHRSDRKEPHLAFDLMEEWRSPIVDSLVMWLINKKAIRPTDFTFPNAEGGVYLENTARRVFLKHFEDRITETVTHPTVQQPVSYRRAIQLQIQRYKKCLRDSQPYDPFIRTI